MTFLTLSYGVSVFSIVDYKGRELSADNILVMSFLYSPFPPSQNMKVRQFLIA